MSPLDEAIHAYLAERKPERLDAFMGLVGVAVEGARPALRRRAESFRTGLDVDEVIGQTVERAIEHLIHQWHGRAAFAFRRDLGLSFESWLLQILGRPAAGRRSGVIGEMIQSRRRTAAVMAPLEAEDADAAVDAPDGRVAEVEAAVGALAPREQFVIRAAFGLHPFADLDAGAIARLTQLVGFDAAMARKIARRASAIARTDRKPSTTLERADIARLLDVGERQIGNIKAASLARLTLVFSALADPQLPA